MTRDGFICRSGNLSSITSKGLETLRELHISTIISLTDSKEAEVLYANDPLYSGNLKGFKLLKFPLYQEDFDKKRLFAKYSRYALEGQIVIAQEYVAILRAGPAIIRNILLQILDNPGEVYIIHCSMGKDRTGIVFAILLSLAGVSKETVSEEYSLNEVALEPLLPKISALAQRIAPCSSSEIQGRRVAQEAIKSSKDAMLLTLQMVEAEFGGVIRYVKEICGLSAEDIELIQHHLIQKRR
ncbi:protein-tyrosine phosphatase-like protein [Penicillium chermesinum]|uniref:Protein-tyrosine phosphatase-like protein n=1 Tax=Penicillium chermesinum TaxID=63820 RepID=A0A9W9PHX2_9EURO|nr:protein-tyrosine phosphatase-like protein [Penicillium chermesinum]KAJ5246467.1 protein-tyrosine phosphatase-like protein [Penicillium chermesinum]KAJ6144740.1 protein-tyrosine phosphatase-like protein [Penicillium chermesinum]